jgi:hypothetical protein
VVPSHAQAAWTHLRYVGWEVDLYRPTLVFPSLPFHRLLLLARTLLSSAMVILFPLQTGAAQLGPSRQEHGPSICRRQLCPQAWSRLSLGWTRC